MAFEMESEEGSAILFSLPHFCISFHFLKKSLQKIIRTLVCISPKIHVSASNFCIPIYVFLCTFLCWLNNYIVKFIEVQILKDYCILVCALL